MNLVTILALVITVISCKVTGFGGSGRPGRGSPPSVERDEAPVVQSRTSGSEQTSHAGQGIQAETTKRPTDDNEGVEGYLVDPALIAAATSRDGVTTITGRAGAVSAAKGDITTIVVGVWTPRGQIPDMRELAKGPYDLPVTSVACSMAQADGGFAFNSRSVKDRLIVSVGVACDLQILRLPKSDATTKTQIAIELSDGSGFGSPKQAVTSDCQCPSGQVFYNDFGCRPPGNGCDPYVNPTGPFCGCNGVTYKSFCAASDAGLIKTFRGACEDVTNGPVP